MDGGRDTRPHEVIFLDEIQDIPVPSAPSSSTTKTIAPWHHQRVRMTGNICQLDRRARSCILMDRSTTFPHISIHVDLSLISVDIPLEMNEQCQFLGELRQVDTLIETLVVGRHPPEQYTQGQEPEAEMVVGVGKEMDDECTSENGITVHNHHTSSNSSSSSSSSSSSTENNHYSTSISDHHISGHHDHLSTVPTLRGVYLYATECRMVPELDIVLLKQTIIARRTFLATIQK